MPPFIILVPAVVVAVSTNRIGTLVTLDVAYMGQPFLQGPAQTTLDLKTMDIAYMGQPFVPSTNN